MRKLAPRPRGSLALGFDIVISLLGNHGLASQPAIIDAAVAGGIREFYPSEYGADIDVEPYRSNRYFRDKQITRKHLELTANETQGFGYTYMLVGAITEYLATPFFGVDTEKRTFTFYGEPQMKAEFTSIGEWVSSSTLQYQSMLIRVLASQDISSTRLCSQGRPSPSDG